MFEGSGSARVSCVSSRYLAATDFSKLVLARRQNQRARRARYPDKMRLLCENSLPMARRPSFFRNAFSLLKQTGVEWLDDKAPQLGAALAYYTVFSLAPLVLVLLAIIGVIYRDDPAGAWSRVTEQMGYFLDKSAVQVVTDIAAEASKPICARWGSPRARSTRSALTRRVPDGPPRGARRRALPATGNNGSAGCARSACHGRLARFQPLVGLSG